MSIARPIPVPALFTALLAGCQLVHGYRPVEVETRDVETKQPIAGVQVRLSYPLETSLLAPSEARGTTGHDGVAHLQAAPFGRAGIMMEVTCKGYLNEVRYLSVEEVRTPSRFVMELCADPAPTVELVVPATYRGLVKAELQVREGVPIVPGERLFRFNVSDTGVVTATGPALFRHVNAANLRIAFADGRPLTPRAKDSPLGYWYVKCEGKCYHFFVGTPGAFELFLRGEQMPEVPKSSDSKGRHGKKSDPAN